MLLIVYDIDCNLILTATELALKLKYALLKTKTYTSVHVYYEAIEYCRMHSLHIASDVASGYLQKNLCSVDDFRNILR